MDRGFRFSADLLRMMLSEERQKFVSALGRGASWKELLRIRKTIDQLNKLLDSRNSPSIDGPNPRSNENGPR
jgi:hypothetical protein